MIRNYVKNSVAKARSRSTEGSPRSNPVSDAILNENVVANTTFVYLTNLSTICTGMVAPLFVPHCLIICRV